jgi:hypothetical protein
LSILDFYQLTTSTSDFKSRSSDVFDVLGNLEKQHDAHTKTQTPVSIPDEETPSSSHQNPIIPSHAITFKKRPADDSFIRPTEKWKKYDLDDVNEHHISNTGNRHALNDFLRTRVKPTVTKETEEEEETPSAPIFKRPMKKQILTNEDDDKDIQFIPIRAPLPLNTNESKTPNDNDDETPEYKLTSIRKKPRGVLSTNEKKPIKTLIKSSDDNNDDEDEEDVNDELFEP